MLIALFGGQLVMVTLKSFTNLRLLVSVLPLVFDYGLKLRQIDRDHVRRSQKTDEYMMKRDRICTCSKFGEIIYSQNECTHYIQTR